MNIIEANYTDLDAFRDLGKMIFLCNLASLVVFRVVCWLVHGMVVQLSKKTLAAWLRCIVLNLLLPIVAVFASVLIGMSFHLMVTENDFSLALLRTNVNAQTQIALRLMMRLSGAKN